MDKLTSYRNQIDKIDTEIMKLLEKRFDIVLNIKNLKTSSSIPVLDKSREHIVLKKTSKYSHFPQIEHVYKALLETSKNLQKE